MILSQEVRDFERSAHLAELRMRAIDDLGPITLLPFTLGLVDLPRPEREPAGITPERAIPGSTEHGLGAVGIHQVIPRRPSTFTVPAQPDRAALGYAA